MKPIINDVHQQFAAFFHGERLAPYAYLVSKKLSEGHICVDLSALDQEKDYLPPVYQPLITKGIPDLSREKLVAGPGESQPFILHHGRLYLQRYFRYETMILEGIRRLLETEAPVRTARCEALLNQKELIQRLFPRSDDSGESSETDWQLAGVLLGAIGNLTIITGGPGTGKTTTLANMLTVLYALEPTLNIALAAPTGKAAMRMAESLAQALVRNPDLASEKIRALEPMTLHRLLKPMNGSPHFRHHADNPLSEDVIIVDEASMVDAALLAKLLDAVKKGSRLILLGDKHQLASVEAGSILGDLCQDEHRINVTDPETAAALKPLCALPTAPQDHPLCGHIVELIKSRRFGPDSGIGKVSAAILAGNAGAIKSVPGEVEIDHSYDPDILSAFLDGFEAFIAEKDISEAYKKFGKLRILCAVRQGERGVYRLNSLAEEYLKKRKLIRITGEFYEHRPVIIGRNYYELGLFNGDTGIIRADQQGVLKAWFPDGKGGMREILPHYISEAQTVFAMTIHKSQGSEFDRVLVVLPEQDRGAFLTQELLYTAITRARKQVIIQGTASMIREIAGRTVQRVSGINERFNDDFKFSSTH
jgi:exodeoxyribonuclease V alpha subunit